MPNVTVTHAGDNPDHEKIEAKRQAQRDKADGGQSTAPASPRKAKPKKAKRAKPAKAAA